MDAAFKLECGRRGKGGKDRTVMQILFKILNRIFNLGMLNVELSLVNTIWFTPKCIFKTLHDIYQYPRFSVLRGAGKYLVYLFTLLMWNSLG